MLNCPPQHNELEITVCGPGVGESILVHLGDQNWIIVDSTLISREPWPLSYLQRIGVDPSKSVRLVVATHWHSDHVAGIHRVLDACESAQFIFSRALLADEFKKLLARNRDNDLDKVSAPLAEIRRSFAIACGRQKSWRLGGVPFKLIGANTIIWSGVGAGAPQVWALSPSPQDEIAAISAFANQFMDLNDFCSGLTFKNPNHGSVVLRLDAGEESILLGADLINLPETFRGWKAILNDSIVPSRKSAVFKVPHHGSRTSHNSDVWRELLSETRHAVVTPYLPSELPGSDDIKRISDEGCNLSITHQKSFATVKRRREVEKSIGEKTKKYAAFRMGRDDDIVRFRKTLSSDQGWRTEHFGTAYLVP